MSVVGLGCALLLDLTHESADVLARVPRQADHLALLHALPYGISHRDSQRGAGILGALLGGVLGAHCLPQCGDGLFGGGHTDMFAHQGGHTKVRHFTSSPALVSCHINVASWVWRPKGINHPIPSCPMAIQKEQHMAVSKRLRYEILRRDNYTCRYCGASAPDVPLRVDHVTPVALGGTDTADNLVTACEPCNSGKSSSSPDAAHVAAVSDDALRWAEAMKQAADNLRKQETPKLEYRDAFLAEWNRWHLGKDETKKVPLPNNWKQTVDRFRLAGIPTWMWADIVDAAMANQKVKPDSKFRYVCGIAWNKVTELQAEARRIVNPNATQPKLPPLPEALTAIALEVWGRETGEHPTDEQEAELRAGVVEAIKSHIDADEIIKAAKYAAWFGCSSIPQGLAEIEAEGRHMGTLAVWESAWAAASGQRPPKDAFNIFTKVCSALAETSATTTQLHLAAAFAGAHLTPHLHFGIDWEHLKAAGVEWVRQRAIDFWVAAFAATNQHWPADEHREAVNRSIDRIRDDSDFTLYDLWAAAASAGAYGDTDLSTSLTRNLSVFEIAAKPLAGGGN